ncbi:FGGY family carbohydrate kinase [Allokutzneria sp. A3M-2-11 16]|uniref:FGGY-family carbohydrate kinase n=1 Tax=Allokutzneria sp. A3M-2-11 16 TaxID=2962043 RepID=UPI0020B6A25A|nr:FGGY family carbohydrate kinase [Allokutzneria sp. A3M-2-11 16]MCP3804604.1 FGGY family carbohydrate kinase [Allokutzneria sp. A3M-2-11 16]
MTASDGDLVAGVDIGTTNIKIGLFDALGGCANLVRLRTPSTVDRLVEGVVRGMRACVDPAGRSPVAVGVAGMAETGAALDAAGAPLTDLISWTDSRGAEEAGQINRHRGSLELYRSTGRWASAKSPLAKWMWLRRNDPAVLDAMACWAGAGDLVVHALTGEVRTHPTLAARTLAYDLARGDYEPDLLALAGLRREQMPPLTGFDGRAGVVSPRAAAATGLPAGIPVINTGHDHAVGAWAAGVREPGVGCLSLGTAEAVVLPVSGFAPEEALAHGFTSDPSADGRHICLVGGLPTSGALVDWMRDVVGGEEDAPLPTGIIVQPYLRGRVAPAPDPDLRLSFAGVTERHRANDLVVAAIEGTCLHTRWILDEAARIGNISLKRLVFLGGQANIPVWMRVKTALSPVPVSIPRTADAVCAGAALRAFGAPVLPSVAAPTDAALQSAYQPVYKEFLRVIGGR